MFGRVIVAVDELTPGQERGYALAMVVIAAAVVVYLLPTIVAAIRHVPNLGSIVVINIFAGFTLWGWVAAMALACRHVDRPVAATKLAGSTPLPATTACPGWYRDPRSPNELRYFDGHRWTGRVARPRLEPLRVAPDP